MLRPEFNPNLPRPPQQGDNYGQGRGEKVFGYPQGQSSRFLDGRLIRNCVFDTTHGVVGPVAPPVIVFGNLTIRDVPENRAVYIYQMTAIPFDYAFNDAVFAWQIWSDGVFITASDFCCFATPIEVYFPPLSSIELYHVIAVGPLAPAGAYVANFAVNWVEFDALDDKWEWGRARGTPNPAAVPW